jgi:pyruvate dehydrogenase E1 component alpha subunit
LFVCENNGYAQATPVEYAVAVKDIADRAAAYGMPGEVVDGQDASAVFEAAQRAAQRARLGKGPTLIECKTYRYYGHHQGDNPLRYRTAEEEQGARDRDCIKRFRRDALSGSILTDDEIRQIEERVKSSIDEAVKFAEGSPLPDAAELYRHVYVG